MSLSGLINERELPLSKGVAPRGPASYGEIVAKAFNYGEDHFQLNSRSALVADEYEKNVQAMNRAHGKEIRPEDAPSFDPKKLQRRGTAKTRVSTKRQREIEDQKKNYINEAIAYYKEQDPERYASVKTSDEVRQAAIDRAKKSQRDYEEAEMMGDSSTAGFLGQMAAGFLDPANLVVTGGSLALAPFTGGLSTSGAASTTFARSIISTILKEAAVNAAFEVVTQPMIAQWQREIGNDYGFRDMAENVGFAAIFGGGMGAASRGIRPSARLIFGRMADMDNLPKSVRNSAAIMREWAEVSESMPYANENPLTTAMHNADLQKTADVIMNQGRALMADELGISEAHFHNIDTTIKSTDTEIEKTRKLEMQKFQDPEKRLSPEVMEEIKPKYKINELPQQILDKAAETKGGLRAKDFMPEELEMLKSAGIKPNKQGQIKKTELVKQRKAREQKGKLKDLSNRRTAHIRDYNDRIVEGINERVPVKETEISNTIAEEIPDTKDAKRIVDNYESPETIALENKEFNDLVASNPDMKVDVEIGNGQTVKKTLREIVEDMEQDQRLVDNIIDCGMA